MLKKRVTLNNFSATHPPMTNNFRSKKKLHRFFSALTIMLAVLLILTACPTPKPIEDGTETGGGSGPNITALDAKIAEAELAKEGVVKDTNESNVPSGRKWVTQLVMTNFNTAIDNAKAARTTATTQTAVDAAVNTLSTAIGVFNGAKGTGTKTSGFNQSDLSTLISDTNNTKNGVKTSVDGKDVSPQEYWVTSDQMNALNDALNNAQQAQDADIDLVYNALNTALINFIAAKKPGTGTPQRTITISGLEVPDGTSIEVFLQEDDQINTEWTEMFGYGTIQDKTVTVTFNTPINGSYYAFFYMDTGNPKLYISKSKITFSDTAYSVVKTFTDFKEYVYKYTFGELPDMMGSNYTIPSGGITLDQLFQQLTDMNYADAYQQQGYTSSPLFKNEELSQPFSGSDRVNANTTFYTKSDLMGGGGSSSSKIGEITGSITLTNIPSPAPKVYISAFGSGSSSNWWGRESQINLTSVTGTSATLNWSLPLHSDNNSFNPSQGFFCLRVEPSGGGGNSFEISIPTRPDINSPNDNVGSLGSVSLSYITLSGTITALLKGQPVPFVEIQVRGARGFILLTSPAANAAWSIYLPASDSSNQLDFWISGYQNRNGNRVFEKVIPLDFPVDLWQDKSGIILNVGNITTVPGTEGNPIPLTADTWTNGSITSSTPNSEIWYSFNVTSGIRYNIWWNDSNEGDHTKTLDVMVSAYYTNGASPIFEPKDAAWSTPQYFTAYSSGTIKLKVRPYYSSDNPGIGTFAIVYSTSGIRP